MPRRSDHSRSEFIELAVSAAEAITAESGEAGLNARAIARRIGYSPGSLYLAFENLDDVILHLNGRTLDRMHRCMADNLDESASPLEQLKRAAYAYAAFARENPHLWRLCFEHRLPEGKQGPEWLDTRIGALAGLILEPLSRASGQEGDRLAEAAQALWAGVHGICILTLTNKLHLVGSHTIENLIDALIGNYLRGIAAKA